MSGKAGTWVVGGVLAAVLLLGLGLPLLVVMLTVVTDQGGQGGTCQAVAESGESGDIPGGWRDEVEAAARTAGLPTAVLAAQLEAESGWDPDVVSPAGAAGLAQFMPDTWPAYGEGDPLDPVASIQAQGRYMKALMNLAGEHTQDPQERVRMALAAYNWGPGNMDSVGWDWTKGPRETTSYVPRILDGAQVGFAVDCQLVTGQWDGDLGDGEWTSPLPEGKMTGAGAYGPRNIPGYPAWANNHAGIDLATGDGAGKVIAPTDLRVTGEYPTDGCVLAKATTGPPFGLEFCHLDADVVSVGDKLKRGDVIGEEGGVAGNLGGRTVEHLHFAIYEPGGPDPQYPGHQNPVIDPTPILRAKGAL